MSDKVKVREGNDGYSYPYTSPDLVIDKNGKSNTTKFNEIDAQFKDIAKQTITTDERTKLNSLENYDDTEIKKEINGKASKNEIFSMANMGQDIREAMTGGSVAIVGKNAVLTENIVDSQVTPTKTNFLEVGNNLFNKDVARLNTYMDGNGNTTTNNKYFITEYISVVENEKYTITKFRLVTFFTHDYVALNGKEINDSSSLEDNTITVPESAKFMVVAGYMSVLDTFMIIKGSMIPINYEPYSLKLKNMDKYSAQELLTPNSITLEYIKGSIVNHGNMFDKTTAIAGKYIESSSGTIANNTAYYASDFIPVEKDKKYTVSNCRTMAFYDVSKNYISGENGNATQSKTVTSPMDGYARFSVAKASIDTYMIVQGESLPATYTPYSPNIKKRVDWLEITKDNLSNDIKLTNEEEIIDLRLPNEIRVAKNTTIDIYNKQICWCGNVDNFHFEYNCSIGYTLKRKFVIEGSKYKEGNYPLTVKVYNNNLKEVASATTNIKIVDKSTNADVKKLLCIGDSLTNNKLWLNELLNLSKSLYGSDKIELVGTLGNGAIKHEGRSGWSSVNYVQDSSYDYLGNYKVKATLATVPISKKQYTSNNGSFKWEIENVELIENNSYWVYMNRLKGSGALTATGTLTETDSGVTGDSTISYTDATVTSKNPFWNSSTSKVDFKYYETQTGIKPDVVQIYLGTNDYGRADRDVVNNIKTLIDAILRDWNIPIMVVLVPFRGNQDGIGLQEGNLRIDIKNRLTVFNQHKAYIEAFDNYNDKVKLVHVGATHDSEFNFGMVQKPVNPRNEFTTPQPIESVHPQKPGYLQMADIMWGTLLDVIK